MKKLIPFTMLFAIGVLASAQNENWLHKVDATLLEKTADGSKVEFLIVLTEQADVSTARNLSTKDEKAEYVFSQLRQTAENSQKGVIQFLTEKKAPHQPLFIANLIKTKGGPSLIQALAERDDVAQIQDNPSIRFEGPMDKAPGIFRSIEWGIEKVNGDDVWALGYRGQGVTVGGQDTGYEWEHPALKAQYRGYDEPTDSTNHNYNWHDAIHEINPNHNDPTPGPDNNPCGLDSDVPCDDHNHGTHTMGTMVGLDGDNEIGLAPAADWCGCRNMERGWGTPFTYLECFQWFIAPTDLNDANPDPTKSPHVIANSWSCPESEGCNPSNFNLMNLAVNNLKLAGTVVVVSAGNSGSGCSTVNTPAAIFENSFSVGATDINDTIAGFSSRGPVTLDGSGRLKPNVSAPGVNVRSSIRDGGYATFSGTSMAGPHVAGVVALMISANPELAGQVELIETILEQTATPLTSDQTCGDIPGSEVPNHTYGHGRIDALAAVEEALSLIVSPVAEAPFADGLKVFPNPFSHTLNVEVKNWSGELTVEVSDMNGRFVLQRGFSVKNNGAFSLDMAGQPSGVYFYRVSSGENMCLGKVVKK